jgi:hypothetical protein
LADKAEIATPGAVSVIAAVEDHRMINETTLTGDLGVEIAA